MDNPDLMPIVLGSNRDCSAYVKSVFWKNNKNYHKFTVVNGGLFNKQSVLSAILKHVSPHYLLPIMYESSPTGDAQFLSKNCWDAVKALISSNFCVILSEHNVQVELMVCLGFKKAHDIRFELSDFVQLKIRRKLSSGGSSGLKTLDLSNMEMEDGPVYFPLWLPKFQRTVVQSLQLTGPHLRCLNLSHNKITSLFEFSKLYCPSLEELNLSYNEISMTDMVGVCAESVKVLYLEGNPLCQGHQSHYVNSIRALYPHLTKLDGMTLIDGEIPYITKNCLVDSSVEALVDQFLHHYFMWFDKVSERKSMIYMYRKDAAISLSCNLDPNHFSFPMYNQLSRNILKISNYGKSLESFKCGLSHIQFMLCSLPYLEIDPSTSTVDIPYYIKNKVIQICMAGIFRDATEEMFWIGFTFILQASESHVHEWKIVNQMISINSATPQQTKGAFGSNLKKLDMKNFEPTKSEVLMQFKELTNLNPSYCEQFLNDASWNLEGALQSFVDQFKGDYVPEEAFLNS